VEVELEATTLQQQQQPQHPSLHDDHHQYYGAADGAATSESPRDCAFECKSGQEGGGWEPSAPVARGSCSRVAAGCSSS
jgi:hypothetical protein